MLPKIRRWFFSNRLRNIALGILPALLALVAVVVEASLPIWANSTWARNKAAPAVVLLVFVLLIALLQQHLRKILIATLCFGVSFMAIRTAFGTRLIHLPFQIDLDLADMLITAALLLVASLSGIAAIGETIKPGTVWARRCYFGAAAIYFFGYGITCYGVHGTWQSLMLCGTGITAALGSLFADRIVLSEQDSEEEEFPYTDEEYQQKMDAKHRQSVKAKTI